MNTRTLTITCLALLALTVAACGGGGAAAPSGGGAVVGNAANGESLYKQNTIGSTPGCVTCHSLEPDVVIVGPSHAGVATRAAAAVAGMSAEDYLRQSIVEPNAHIVEGYTAGIMYQNYGKDLSEQQIADLVAFLMTLK